MFPVNFIYRRRIAEGNEFELDGKGATPESRPISLSQAADAVAPVHGYRDGGTERTLQLDLPPPLSNPITKARAAALTA